MVPETVLGTHRVVGSTGEVGPGGLGSDSFDETERARIRSVFDPAPVSKVALEFSTESETEQEFSTGESGALPSLARRDNPSTHTSFQGTFRRQQGRAA